MCSITIRHKDKHILSRFFLVQGSCPELLVMPDIKLLGILSMKCCTVEPIRNMQDINEHSIDDKSCPVQTKVQMLIQLSVAKTQCRLLYCRARKGSRYESNWCTNVGNTQPIQTLSDINCFTGTFHLQVKDRAKPYHAPPRCFTYTLQQPFKDVLDWLQKNQHIILHIGMDFRLEHQLCTST